MNAAPFHHPAFRGRFGVARRDITPPPGIHARQWGAAKSEVHDGVHRPLTLTAVTIQDAEKETPPLALVSLDLCVWRTPSREGEGMLAAAARAGFESERVILTLTHTHSAAQFSPSLVDREGGDLIPEYNRQLERALEQVLRECLENAEPGLLEAHAGYCALATNRDMPEPGGEGFLVGWNREGEADAALLVGRISRTDGTALATIVNYACHPTILAWENTRTSPDYPGAMRELVERETGAPVLFLQGASAELAPRNQYTADSSVADKAGRGLGHAVLATLADMQTPGHELRFEGLVESGARLGLWREHARENIPGGVSTALAHTDLPLKEDLPSLAAIEKELKSCRDPVLSERLRRWHMQRSELGEGTIYAAPHRLWRLGDVIVCSISNEVYSVLQRELRVAAAPRALFIATLACGGVCSYLPPQEFYGGDVYTVNATPVAAGGLETMMENLRRCLADL